MSCSPSEALAVLDRHIEFQRQLVAKYPDARPNDERWEADVPLEECEVEVEMRGGDGIGSDYPVCRLFVQLGDGRVYLRTFTPPLLTSVFQRLIQDNPAAYDAFVAAARAEAKR